MKTVFSNTQCAHIWAQQTQPHGRSNSMHFDGPTIYSYQTPIAKFYRVGEPAGFDVVLISSERYSATTSSKHMPAVRRALSDNVRTFSVPHVELDPTKARMQGMGTVGTHLMNLDAIVARYVAERERQRRKVKVYSDSYSPLQPIARDARAYAQVFGLPVPQLDPQADSAALELIRAARQAKRETPEYLAKQARAEEIRLANLAARNLANFTRETERRNEWLTGARDSWHGVDEKGGAYLRLSAKYGTRVETSQGAHIPVADAMRIIPLIRACKAAGEVFEPYDRAAYSVGAFQVNRIDANGDIKAGCHFIQFAEIDKIGKLLGV